jgi:hypothetical protein
LVLDISDRCRVAELNDGFWLGWYLHPFPLPQRNIVCNEVFDGSFDFPQVTFPLGCISFLEKVLLEGLGAELQVMKTDSKIRATLFRDILSSVQNSDIVPCQLLLSHAALQCFFKVIMVFI